jgi:hypothetical protein
MSDSSSRNVPEHVLLVEKFNEADKAYLGAQEEVLDGTAILKILAGSSNPDHVKREWTKVLEQLQNLLEARNTALKEVQAALRPLVALKINEERGPDGKAAVIREGPFSVSSVTRRAIDPVNLRTQCFKEKVWDDITKLTYTDKSGNTVHAVREVLEVDYEPVRDWLLSRGMAKVFRAVYAEEEMTPKVLGPKKLAFLGDKV